MRLDYRDFGDISSFVKGLYIEAQKDTSSGLTHFIIESDFLVCFGQGSLGGKMFLLNGVAVFALLQAVAAQDPDNSIPIVNLINPLWALPDGENSTRGLGASVVNVDSTATTYAVSCDATAELVPGPTPITCIWETVGPQVFTQWETSQHFALSFTGFDDVAGSSSYEGDYTFPSTLAPTITGTFTLSVAESEVTRGEETIPATTQTRLQTGTTSATWYAISITAGEEKLAAALSSRTATGTPSTSGISQLTTTQSMTESSSSGTASGSGMSSTGSASSPTVTSMSSTDSETGGAATTSPSTSSSTAAAEKAGGNVGWVGAMVVGVLGMFVL
ncbi:hypothetical protein DL98DRAFT_508572 [Cadophora sp. DSE1049]|nr:hypothetical protein DL98DRAFT_508572 [Cadophora sp. DSE1049]